MYASTYVDGGEAVPVLVRTREGRPIKVEGNFDSKLTEGATTARIQGAVLNLYDAARIKFPMHQMVKKVHGKPLIRW
jgi:anaerobic selenocysteine-containing dehydrogenase